MDDLISEFITETTESIGTLDSELVKLEQNPNDENILGNIFRLMHTIKGTCGFLGLPRLETVAHAGENILGRVRDKKIVVNGDAISLVLEALDCIKMILGHLSQNGSEPAGDDAPLAARLNFFAENGKVMGAGDVAPAAHGHDAATVNEEVHTPAPVVAAPVVSAVSPEPEPAPVNKTAEQAKAAPQPQAQAAAAPAGGDPSTQSIRVSIDVLENLMQMVGELVLTRNQLMQIARTRNDNTFLTPLQQLSHITTELQEGVMKTRMQPIGNAWSKFPRLIRDLSLELGKKIELKMEGAETELDRQLLDLIKDPLTHMVRNSCDHGLERPEDRLAAGKPDTGTVRLSAFHEGGHIIIEIADDGRGLNINRIKQKMLENGLATQAEIDQMAEQQIMQYIFRAGFSTAEKVTSVSGRGVGMDVVRTNIEKIGGTVELSSTLGKGSVFHIKIPLTLAIVSVIIVETAGERFAFPQINVQELVRTSHDSEHKIETINGSPVLRLRGTLLPLVQLSDALKINKKVIDLRQQEQFIVVCHVGATSFGIIVDKIFDTEEIVVKPVSEIMKHINVYSGNTILGDGSVIMILDPNGLARGVAQQDMTASEEEAKKKLAASGEKQVKLLVFHTGKGAPKAVPLELVSRLEEVDATKIEWSGEFPVIQYRGDLMRLISLDANATIPTEGTHEVIVFNYDGKSIGLMVERISDIVEVVFSIKLSSKKAGILGSMVVHEKTTDIIDVGSLLKDIVDVSVPESLKKMNELNKPKLLYVEDSMFFRNMTMPYLSAAGYEVTTASNGPEALAKIAKSVFDVIVTDIEMPEMDGFAFAEACRSTKNAANVPIFAFSSTRAQDAQQRVKNNTIRDFIPKTERARLLEAISNSLTIQKEAA